jgi:hypothetical protein
MFSSEQSARCRDMGTFHRYYLLYRHPQECLYNLQLTSGCVLPMHSLLQAKSVCHSPCDPDFKAACTSEKRFLWGPHDVGSDSLHGATVLSLSDAFPLLGSIWHSTTPGIPSKRTEGSQGTDPGTCLDVWRGRTWVGQRSTQMFFYWPVSIEMVHFRQTMLAVTWCFWSTSHTLFED